MKLRTAGFIFAYVIFMGTGETALGQTGGANSFFDIYKFNHGYNSDFTLCAMLGSWSEAWLLVLVFAGCIVFSSFFFYYLKLAYFKHRQSELSGLIRRRTHELEKTNEVLLDRQTQIELQSREIKEQAERLKEVNSLLMQKQKMIQLQANKLRETNDQLSVLNSTKDRFFSIIAHDLRNPFHAVIGFSELLLMDIDKYPAEKTKKYLRLIHASSMNGNNLLDNLLQWSRSQTGRILFKPVQVNLSETAEETMNFLEADALRKQISIQNQVNKYIKVFADPNMLKTVLRNLVSNAIKFTREEGSVKISAAIKAPLVELSVSDTGIGIPVENQKLLFNLDTNISTKGTSYESGTGLGLILCKEFIEKHGGRIWVESEEGIGSIFRFTVLMG